MPVVPVVFLFLDNTIIEKKMKQILNLIMLYLSLILHCELVLLIPCIGDILRKCDIFVICLFTTKLFPSYLYKIQISSITNKLLKELCALLLGGIQSNSDLLFQVLLKVVIDTSKIVLAILQTTVKEFSAFKKNE